MFRTHYNREELIWTGNHLVPYFNPKISVGQIMRQALICNGPKIAQVSNESGVEMTFDDIRIKANRAAKHLQKLGYQPGTVFGFMVRNSEYVSSIFFASLFIGCPVNTLDPNFQEHELIHMFSSVQPSVVFCDVANYDSIEHCLKKLKLKARIFTFGGTKGHSKNVEDLFTDIHDEDDFLPVQIDAENHVAAIVCSSGTTGLSKGVCLTHAVLANGVLEMTVVNSDDVILTFSPLNWITSILFLCMGTLAGAKRIISVDGFTPEKQLRVIEKHKVTYLMNSPYQISMLLKCEKIGKTDLSSVRFQMIGGNRVPPDMLLELNKYFSGGIRVHIAYGLSETGGSVAKTYPDWDSKGTVGQLTNGCSIKIIDDNGHRCGPNVDGEIYIKMSYKFSGYYGNEKATTDAVDEDGFLKSGDIGHFDADGNLFIVDRINGLIKYHGQQFLAGQLEDFLSKNFNIDSVCVVGVPDGMGADLATALVIRKENSDITEQDVCDAVADNFPDYYKLRGGIFFVDSFPMSLSGKILKRQLNELASRLYVRRHQQ